MRKFLLLNFVALTTTLIFTNLGFAQGDVDTIIERQGDPTPGETATVDIEMVSLSLVSVEPITVGSVDSFFDVFVDFTPPTIPAGQLADPNCLSCDEILDAILKKLDELADLGAEADKIIDQLDLMDDMMEGLEDDLSDAEAERERMDSGDFVRDETTGKTETARDQAARRAYRADTYARWQAGKITSEQKMAEDRHSYELNEDEIDQWSKKAKQDKDKEIKDLKKDIKDLKEIMDDAMDELAEILAEMEMCDERLKKLLEAFDNCLNICLVGPVDLFDGLGLTPDILGPVVPLPDPPGHSGLFGWLKDLLFGPPVILPGPPVDPEIPFPDGLGPIPYDPFGPIIPLPPGGDSSIGLPPFNPFEVDSFFDVFFEIDVPAVTCPLCDPIRAKIDAKQKANAAHKAQLDKMNSDLQEVNKKLGEANSDLGDANDAMNRFNSGDFVTNHSTGETETARDQAARNEYRTNTYNRWRNGDITSDQKMAEDRHSYELSEAELEQWAKTAEARLKAEQAAAQKKVNDLNAKKAKIQKAIGDLAKKLADCQKQIADLLQLLADCEKLCKDLDALNALLSSPPLILPTSSDDNIIDVLVDDIDYDDFEWDFGDGSSADTSGSQQDYDLSETGQDVSVGLEVRPGDCKEGDPNCLDLDELGCGPGTEANEAGDCVPVEEPRGLLCEWFGIFCPDDDKGVSLTLGGLIDCAETGLNSSCATFDATGDGIVTEDDFDYYSFGTKSNIGLDLTIDISGLDGNDGLTVDDVQIFDDCLRAGGQDCPSLDANVDSFFDVFLAEGPPLGELPGVGFDDLIINTGGGNDDILLSDPLGDLIDIDVQPINDPPTIDGPPSPDFFGDNGIPADFFGPGSEPFESGADGIDLLYFGTTDRTVGLEWPPSDASALPPPPPQVPASPTVELPQNIQEVIARIIRANPLGPCEKLIIDITRIRVGNKYKYTITATRTRDDANCPNQFCPPQTHYESIGTSCDACENGNAGCQVIGTTSAGTNCILCAPPEDDIDDLCANVECDDHDDCTYDNCDPETGDCYYSENTTDDDCRDDEPFTCPQGQSPTAECESSCDGLCETGAMFHDPDLNKDDLICAICTQKNKCSRFGSNAMNCTSATELCPNGTESVGSSQGEDCCKCKAEDIGSCTAPEVDNQSACNCDSNEECAINPQTGCWYCRDKPQDDPPECEDGLVDHSSATALESSGYECSPVQVGQLVCYDCREVDDGPNCTGDKFEQSSCGQCESQGGTCEGPDGDGCYSCVSYNCPTGTYTNECPSNCSSGCDVVAEQGNLTCYACAQSCEDLCAQYDFQQVGIDWSSYIQSYLNGFSCVSGASISLQQGTVGDCTCSNQPTINVDETVPVCAGTPCGDVLCGNEVTCDTGPNETTTVTCSWGGWRQTDINEFVPEIGG